MKPSVNHWVMTIQDSVVLEGHFYMYEHLNQTLRGLLLNHYIEDANTNIEHLIVTALMMRELCDIVTVLTQTNGGGKSST